ncbi:MULTISPECIES: SAM-dependent methyltransferase [unclassified Nocardiopsis]|uniref:SAM-dependent methyltransferase n=1 Tax=Nocardiopsis TaxID=2013 RepID=UPI00387AF8FD
MTTPPPEGVDPHKASPARLYDYYLDGKDNYPVDREVGDRLLEKIPEIRSMALANRAFLRRVVRYMAGEGIDQFLDLGSGLPTADNTHEVAQTVNPDVRVVYVDHDPMAVAHGNAVLATDPERTAMVAADLRNPASILSHPDTRRLIDFDRPVGLLLIAVLHFLPDDTRPYGIVRTLRDVLPTGSITAISHVENQTAPDRAALMEEVYASTSAPGRTRSHAEISRFLDGMEMVHPGVTYVCDWRPELCDTYWPPDQAWVLGGVGHI